MTTVKRLALAALACTVLPACTDWAGYDLDVASGKVPQLANMRHSVIPDPYAMPRLPAPHSIPSENPMGDVPERFSGAQLDSVAPTLRNPYAGGAPQAVLARGAVMFNNNCMVCHGPQGAGNGPVVQPAQAGGKSFGRFPGAPAINGAVTAARSDGYVYAVVAAGRGLMPPYGERVTHLDRWAVVEYVRALQAASGAAPQRAGVAPAQPVPAAPPPAAPATAPATTAPAAAPAPAPAAPPAQP